METHCAKRPAGSAVALVFDRRHVSMLPPVNVIGQRDGHGRGQVSCVLCHGVVLPAREQPIHHRREFLTRLRTETHHCID